ncbi:MAG: glycerate kinase [Sulfurifustis sp.]
MLEVFHSAVTAVSGYRRVRDVLARETLSAPIYVIALGKAACPMARGAADALGQTIRAGFVVTKHGHGEPLPWPVREAGHPVPDDESLAAGAELQRFVADIPVDAQVLVLLSGGASALVEQLPAGASLDTLRRMNEWLLASGRDIAAMNRVRKRLSQLKGGRLAQLLAPRRTLCLAISDVPGDDPRFIASGPLVPDPSSAQEPIDDAPPDVRAALDAAPPLPRADDPCFRAVRFEIIARLADAKRAAAEAARARGRSAIVHNEFVAGDAITAGRRLAQALLASEPGVIHVWGGETTVRLPPQPGRGGRNQSAALSAACALRAHEALFLAAGTDGSDGPTPDAGALVDGGTIERGVVHGMDVENALARADAGSFLEASGDLIDTGPTGTNVMDLMLGLRN